MNDRFDVFAGGFWRSVDMGDKCDCRCSGQRAGDCRHHDTVFVLMHIDQAHRMQFAGQHFAQCQLSRRTGISCRGLIGLRVNFDVAQKSVEKCVHS